MLGELLIVSWTYLATYDTVLTRWASWRLSKPTKPTPPARQIYDARRSMESIMVNW